MSDDLCFECTQCGQCCTFQSEYAYVYLNPRETKALAELLGLALGAFKKKYTFVDDDGWRQLRTKGEACVFLDPDTKGCTVYGARPTQCRTFPFWRDFVKDGKWTDKVREMCEGVGQGRLYTIEEAESRMHDMETSDL